METEHNVFLERERLPTADQIAESLQRHGFSLTLPDGFDPAADEVVLSLRYQGEPAELDYYADSVDVDDLLREDILRKDEAEQLSGRDFLVSVVARDARQLGAADILMAVICELADGRLAVGSEPPFIGADQVLSWAQSRS